MADIPAGSRYVAMGSSFGAGPGITPRAPGSPRRAGQSAGNYAHLVARDLGLDLHDVTYSGATTDDILRPSAGGQPAQLDAVTRATRLVTITAGGNDVGYLPRLTLASLPWPLRALPRARAQVAGFGDPAATDARFASFGRNLEVIARGVADRAPDCRLLFVDYLTILPPAGSVPPAGPAPRRLRRPRSRTGGASSRPGWRRRRRRRRTPAAPAMWRPPPPRPGITPGRPRPGRGGSTSRCAAGRRTTRTRTGWRRSPGSCWPPSPETRRTPRDRRRPHDAGEAMTLESS